MLFSSVSIVFVAVFCQALSASPSGTVNLAQVTPYGLTRTFDHQDQMVQRSPLTTSAGSALHQNVGHRTQAGNDLAGTRSQKQMVAIKGRSAEQIQQANELAGKRIEWFGSGLWCAVSMQDRSCWASYPSASDTPVGRMMESNNSVDSIKALAPRAESHSPFGVDLACSLLSGWRVSNNCWKDDDGSSKPKKKGSTTSASILPTSSPTPSPTSSPAPQSTSSVAAPSQPPMKRNIFKDQWCRDFTFRSDCQKKSPDQPKKSAVAGPPSPTDGHTAADTPAPTTTPPAKKGSPKGHEATVVGGFQQFGERSTELAERSVVKDEWCRHFTFKGYCGKRPLEHPRKPVADPGNSNTTAIPPATQGSTKGHKVKIVDGFQQFS
ncbi:hypothetical protein JHW43_006243 [Diplocarpon mali]|nr:hypothetical protein JHW43_006243 [Diplocarpon mali]